MASPHNNRTQRKRPLWAAWCDYSEYNYSPLQNQQMLFIVGLLSSLSLYLVLTTVNVKVTSLQESFFSPQSSKSQ